MSQTSFDFEKFSISLLTSTNIWVSRFCWSYYIIVAWLWLSRSILLVAISAKTRSICSNAIPLLFEPSVARLFLNVDKIPWYFFSFPCIFIQLKLLLYCSSFWDYLLNLVGGLDAVAFFIHCIFSLQSRSIPLQTVAAVCLILDFLRLLYFVPYPYVYIKPDMINVLLQYLRCLYEENRNPSLEYFSNALISASLCCVVVSLHSLFSFF